jgi:hypothetical protein
VVIKARASAGCSTFPLLTPSGRATARRSIMEGFEDDPGNMGEAEDNTSISSKGNRGGDTVHAGDLGLSSDSDSDTEPRGLSRSSRKGGMSSTSKETHSSGDGDLDDDGSDETASTRHTAPASSMQRPAAVARAGKNSMETLFGKDDEDDEKSVEEEEQTFADVEARSGSVGNLSRKGGMNSGAAAYTPANQTLEFSVLPRPRKGSKLYFARMPNIMGVKTEAFERETFKQVPLSTSSCVFFHFYKIQADDAPNLRMKKM